MSCGSVDLGERAPSATYDLPATRNEKAELPILPFSRVFLLICHACVHGE
jgi:hypothetical protein